MYFMKSPICSVPQFIGEKLFLLSIHSSKQKNQIQAQQFLIPNLNNHYDPNSNHLHTYSQNNKNLETHSKEDINLLIKIFEILVEKDLQINGGSTSLSIQKIEKVAQTIIQYTDTVSQTNTIHKILYLTLKHLINRQKERQKASDPSISGFGLIQWLTNASQLFQQELQTPPILNFEQKLEEVPHKTNKIKTSSSKMKNIIRSFSQQEVNQNANLNEIMGLKKSRKQIKNNQYWYLLEMVENSSLQQLIGNLQHLLNQNSEKQYEKIRRRIKTVIQLSLKRIYLEKCLQDEQKQLSLQSYTKFINEFVSDKQKKQIVSCFSSHLPENISQNIKQLDEILKYCMAFFLGNKQVIRQYSKNNVYLHIKLSLLYIQISNQSPLYTRNYIQSSLENLSALYPSLEGQLIIDFTPEHHYLLSLISLSTPNSTNDKYSKDPLYFHSLFQKLLLICSQNQNQIYAHLIGVLFFHFRFVQKQIFSFDEDYMHNICSDLLLSAAQYRISSTKQSLNFTNQSGQKNPNQLQIPSNYLHRPKSISYSYDYANSQFNENYNQDDEDQIGNLQMSEDYNQMDLPGINNKIVQEYQYGVNQNIGPQTQIQNHYKMNADRDEKEKQLLNETSMEILLIKLLLATISFYRNVVHADLLARQISLRQQLQFSFQIQSAGSINPDILYHATPSRLDQLITNLYCLKMPHKSINSYSELKFLEIVFKYSQKMNIMLYFREYLTNVVRITLNKTGVKSVDKFGVELMILEIRAACEKKQKLHSKDEKQNENKTKISTIKRQQQHQSFDKLLRSEEDPSQKSQKYLNQHSEQTHFQTQTLNLLHSGFLTDCTLHEPFDYSLLDKVRELTGLGMCQLNQNVIQVFLHYWLTYFALENVTIRGRLNTKQINDPKGDEIYEKNTINDLIQKSKILEEGQFTSVPSKKNRLNAKFYESKIQSMLKRLDVIIQCLYCDNLDACGEVLRVAWEVLEDYQEILKQTQKKVSFSKKQSTLMDKMSQKLVDLVGAMRIYLNEIQQKGIETEQSKKMRQMLG